MKENELEQRNYNYWDNGKRAYAIGITLTLTKKYAYLLDKIAIAFVSKDFMKENRK